MDVAEKDMITPTITEQSFYRESGKKQYELSNHLGNVLTVITDKKIPVENINITGEVDYFIVEILSATDYSPFGVTLKEREFTSEKYRFGFNTQEKVNEIAGEGNHYTAEFWEYSPRVVMRWNTDPVKRAHKSPYVINSNNPITNNDPNGDCDDCPKPEFNAGIKLNMTFGKNGGANVSFFAGTSMRTGFATTGLNFSGTLYGGGVGTSSSSPTLFTGVISPSLTLGWGDGTSRPLNTFNSFSGTGVNTSYTNSVSFGQNFTFSSGATSVAGYNRNQRTSYFGLTALNTFSAGSYNDVQRLPFWGDGGDEFWSAGLNASLTYNGFTASYTNDMYYGKSNNKATYADDEIINGINYDRQPAFDRNLNNALETFNFTMPGSMFGGTQVTLGMGRTGRSAMWPSNRMHNTIKDPQDPSKHFHHLFVPNNTSTVFRFGLQR
jgi:hypothetical protein